MSTRIIPQFLLPMQRRMGSCPGRYSTLRRGNGIPDFARTYASHPEKPRVLEKPAKFNPPSHSSMRSKPRAYPGPPLSQEARERQKTKQYPHTMPPEGTFLHWFLTNRSIHVWITIGTLVSLAGFTLITNFQRTSPFAHMLPPMRELFSHPLSFISTYAEVFKLHTAHKSAETAERRKRKVDDVQKRSQYRKAHGLDQEEGFGGWSAKDSQSPVVVAETAGEPVLDVESGKGSATYSDWEGKKKPIKKWLGIW